MKTVLTSKVKFLITFILFTSKIHSAGDEIQICTKSIIEHKLIIITFKDKNNQDIKINTKVDLYNKKTTTKKIPIEFLYYIYQKNGEGRDLTQEEMDTISNKLKEILEKLKIQKTFTDIKNNPLNCYSIRSKFKRYFKEFIQSVNITLNNSTTPNILPVISYKYHRFTDVNEECGGLSFIENVNNEYERYREIIYNNESYKWEYSPDPEKAVSKDNLKYVEDFLKQDPDPQKIQIITTHMIGTPDVKNLEYLDEKISTDFHNKNLHRVKIFYKQGEKFKIKTIFNGPNIEWHKMKDKKFECELPIEIYYDGDKYKNLEEIQEYINTHLNNAIKDEILDFNTLKENFNCDNHLLIYFDDKDYNDVFSIRSGKYIGNSSKISEHGFYNNIITEGCGNHRFYGESIPKSSPENHFIDPDKLVIILNNLGNEIDDKNIKKSDKGNMATRTIKTLGGIKGNDSKIPTKTQDKNNKKGKKPSFQTPNETPKSNQCCKCCGCCPCCKQKT